MGTKTHQADLFARLSRVLELRDKVWDLEQRRRRPNTLSWAQGELLAALEKEGGRLQVQDLAEKAGRGKSTASALVAKLCRRGLVFKMKVSGDGRGAWVVLTEKGRKVSLAFIQTIGVVERHCWKEIPERERLVAERSLRQIEQNLSKGGKA